MVQRLYIGGSCTPVEYGITGARLMQASVEIAKHLENPPVTSVIIEIDPKTAEEILTNRNVGNRPPKPNKVQQFAADMVRDRWGLTGDTIKFGTNGLLLDGQNLLSAGVRSGRSFRTHIVFGLIRHYLVGWILENRETRQMYYTSQGTNTHLHWLRQLDGHTSWILTLITEERSNLFLCLNCYAVSMPILRYFLGLVVISISISHIPPDRYRR